MSKTIKHKVPRELEQYLTKLVEYLKPRMHLGDYTMKIHYKPNIGGVPGLRTVPGTHEGYTAECQIDVVYLQLDIWYSAKMWQKYKDKEYAQITLDLIHEMAHTYTFEQHSALADVYAETKGLQEWLRKMDENAVERIARTIFETMPREIWLPKGKRK